ncbi:hypothetical protein BDZ89DRAFT_404363 [Hymenopellis radicata]|nr:hypothetical protein BDZ89DRAFT_404363 [Hymenopellis radicata]
MLIYLDSRLIHYPERRNTTLNAVNSGAFAAVLAHAGFLLTDAIPTMDSPNFVSSHLDTGSYGASSLCSPIDSSTAALTSNLSWTHAHQCGQPNV